MNLTAAELQLLRSQPHKTNLYLSIYRPNVLMNAIVTGTYSVGDRQISYYGPTSGTYLNLYPDLTVKIGSTPGDDDVGRLRMRGATGTYIDFAENAINWNTGMFLTFLDYIDVQAIYPRIIQDPNNQENVIFYKDFNVPYTNQNTVYGTFPNAGPHRALFLSSGTVVSYWTATGTYNVAGSALTYSWNFDGGSPTGSTAITPGNVTYSSLGHYKTRLRVTAANGGVDDAYRYVSVYNRPGEGYFPPTLKWELSELSGSRSEGGYTARFRLFENIGEIEPNALVVIFSDTWYGGTKVGIGGNAQRNQSIVFAGYILSDTIRFNYAESSVEFSVGSVSEAMKQAEGFSVSCESKASPATWFELHEMTVPKAMYHYLRWHSTVLKVTDFQYTGDDRLVQYFDADRGSLYDAVDSFMRDGMLGAIVSDRQGKLWAEINSFGMQTPFTTIPRYFTYHKQDWLSSPQIDERRVSDMSFVELGGIIYYGVESNAFSANLANAPSTVPLYHGKSERNDGLILLSQQQLNQVAGNFLAHHNTRFPNISLSMAGNYNNLDIAPLEQSSLVISQDDSVRNKSIQDLRYVVEGMEWSYDARKELWRPDVSLMQIATGTAGVTVLIPPTPPDGGYGYPDIELPPLPEFPSAGGQIPSNVSRSMVIHDGTNGPHTGRGVIYTTDFDSSNPQWFTMNNGLTAAQYIGINRIIVTPNGAVYVASEGAWGRGVAEGRFIARAPSLGGTFTIVYDQTTAEAEYTSGDRLIIGGLGYRPDAPETVLFTVGDKLGDTSDVGVYLGGGTTFTKTMTLSDVRMSPSELVGSSFGQNTWGITYYRIQGISQTVSYSRLNAAATSRTLVSSIGGLGVRHVRGGVSGNLYIPGDALNTTFRRSIDDGSTWSTQPASNDMNSGGQGMAADDIGTLLMAKWSTGQRGRSSDSGTTWSGLPNLPFGAGSHYGYMGGVGSASQWIAIGATTVRYSPDFGNTWLNREGNISSILGGSGFMDIVCPVR